MTRTIDSYMAFGSSSTEGSGASQPAKTSYVSILVSRLRTLSTGLRADNHGRGGATIQSFLAARDDVRRARPAIVTLLPFTDYVRTPPDRFRQGYAELL